MNRGRIIRCHDAWGNIYEVPVGRLIFRPSIYGILIEGSRILLSPQLDGYDFPGGGQRVDESIDEALQREFFEETGLRVERLAPVACQTSFYKPSRADEYWNCLLIYFLCRRTGGKLSDKYFDEEERKYARLAEWIPLKKTAGLKYINSVDSISLIRKAKKILKK